MIFSRKFLSENIIMSSKEAERIRAGMEKLKNNKNDINNLIVFDPIGELDNDFKKEWRINPIEQLKDIVDIAVSIEDT